MGSAALFGAATDGLGGAVGAAGGRLISRIARGGKCSFSAETPVATPDGEQAIGSLQVGDQVEAYDPQTGATSMQTVEHVWLNQDHDLIDVTLRSDTGSKQNTAIGASKQQDAAVASHRLQDPPAIASQASDAHHLETIHTTSEHPWLTVDRGWAPAGDLRAGEQVIRLDGSTATVAAVHVVPGAAIMYNLTVSQVHTFAVGMGRYAVHNTCEPYDTDALMPGPYAGKSIPARGPTRNFKAAERQDIDNIGYSTGCHTCGSKNPGTKGGHFVPDHQPPNQLNPNGAPQRLYPHCLACSKRQGGQMSNFLLHLRDFFA